MKNIGKYLVASLVVAATVCITSCKEVKNEPLLSAIYPKSVTMEVPAELQPYIYKDVTGASVLPMIRGNQATLTYIMQPENVTFNDVTWSSTIPAAATVDQSGNVTAVSEGYTMIQVAPEVAYSGSGLISAIRVVVVNSLTPAQSITVNSDSTWVYAGEKVQMEAEILPASATYRTVRWSSSDASIATVDVNGVVTGVPNPNIEAEVTITASALDNSGVIASKTLKVVQVVQPTDVTLDQTFNADNYAWAIGEKSYAINYTTVPENCTRSAIEWKSSNEDIATVRNGVIYFNQTGEFGDVTITATCPETGNNSSVKLHLAEGLVRELFHNENNITWDVSSAHKNSGATSTWSYGKLHITTFASNATNQRADFTKTDPRIWLSPTTYPLFVIRMTDVLDDYAAQGVTSRYINFDGSSTDYKGNFGGSNNKWLRRYKLDDGSYAVIYDLSTQSWATGGVMTTAAEFTTLQFKYADIRTISTTTHYDVFWVQTFKTDADVRAYIAAEGRTIVD